MGRKKIPISKIENMTKRKTTYQKRSNGLLKKADELSVLCDVDIALIMFSPTGKVTQFARDDRIEEVIARFTNTSEEEKMKSKVEMLENINKLVQKLDTEEVEQADMLALTSGDGGEMLLATAQQPDCNDENFGSNLGGQMFGIEEVEQVDMLALTSADDGERLVLALAQQPNCNDKNFGSDLGGQMFDIEEVEQVDILALTSVDGGERLLATAQQPDWNDENFGSNLGGQMFGIEEVEQVDMLALTSADSKERLSATAQQLDCNDNYFWSDLRGDILTLNDQEIKMVDELLNYPTSP